MKSKPLIYEDQQRIKAAFGMDTKDQDDPSNDNYDQMVKRFYEKRARYVRVFVFVLAEINLAMQLRNFSKIPGN